MTLETAEDWYANASLRRGRRSGYAGFEAAVDSKLSGKARRAPNGLASAESVQPNTMELTAKSPVGPRVREALA